ncbi:MAG: YHS domain-containing protein [Candidatus Hodarchaeota archaeon]
MRTKSIFGILIVLLSISILANFSFAQKDDSKKEETIACPVSGEKVLKSEAVGPYSYNGKDYYFGCNGCLEKFKKDPETYLNKTEDLICGMTVDKRTAKKVSYEGKDIYFCSDNCKAEFEKDPKTYMMKAMKTSKAHIHDENCKCEGCTGEKKEGKECCASKAKAAKKPSKI